MESILDLIFGTILECFLEVIGYGIDEFLSLIFGRLFFDLLPAIFLWVLVLLHLPFRPSWQRRTQEYYVGSGLGYTNILGLRDDP